MLRSRFCGIFVLLFLFGPVLTVQAQNYTWDPAADQTGSGGAGTWNLTTSNWLNTGTDAPWTNATTAVAVFGGTGGTVSLGTTGIQANGLTFGVDGYILDNGGTAANTLTLAGTAPTISVTNLTDSATISAIVAGTLGLNKAGAGTLVLSNAANTYTGATTITAGTLSIGADLNLGAAPGAATAGYITLNGGTLATTTTFTLSTNRGIALGTGGGTINTLTGTTLTYGGAIAGSTLLTKSGAGTLTLSGTNGYTGGLTITAGTVSVGAESNLGSGGITLNGGTANFTYTGAAYTATAKSAIVVGAGGGTYTLGANVKVTGIANMFTGSGTLTRAGANSLANNLSITAANSFTGAWIFTGGVTETSATGLGTGVASNTLTLSGGELAPSNATLTQNVIINSGTLGGDNGTSNYSGTITINGAFNIRLGDFYQNVFRNLILSGNITGTSTFGLYNGNGTTVVTGGIGQTLFLNGADNSGYAPAGGLSLPAGFVVSFGTPASIPSTGVKVNGATGVTLGGIGVGYVPASQSALPTLVANTTSTFGGIFQINVANFNVPLDLGTLYGTSTSPTGGTNGIWFLGSGGTGTYTATTLAASNGTYRLGGGFGSLTITNAVLTGNAAVVFGAPTANLVGTNGTGTVTLQGANDYTGATTINLGHSVIITNGSALGSAATGTTIAAGGNLSFSGGITVAEPITVTGTGSTASTSNYVNGLVNISGTNTLTGTITATTGTNNFRISTTAGTINLQGNISLSGGGTTTGLVIAGAGTVNQTGTISGGGSLIGTSTGTSTLSATNTFTGKVQIQQGTFSVASINSVASPAASSSLGVPAGATSVIELGSSTTTGALTYTGTSETTDRAINLIGTTGGGTITNNGTGLLKFTANMTSATTGAGVKTLTIQGTGTSEFAGIITDNTTTNLTNVTKSGSGTWTLSGLSTFTGTTTVSQGTLVVNTINSVSGGASSLGNPSTTATGTIALGATTNAGNLTYTGTGGTTNRVLNLAGTTGGSTLDMSGTGTLTFSSALTATGAGIKTLTLTGSTAGIGVLGGAIVNNSATNTTALTKTGTGTWVLAGANTYTAATTINGGLLRINGNSSAATGAVAVNAGAYLGGTGTVGGAITLAANAGIDLRDATVGTLALSSTLTFSGTATAQNSIAFDLGTSTVDSIAATGAVTASTANSVIVTFNQLTGTPLANGTYTLITSAATSVPTGFALATTASGGHTYALTTATTGNILQVTVGTAITGPASAVFSGATSTSWTAAGNWNTDATSSTPAGAIPGVGSNVSFYTTTPAATNLGTVLNADFEINSLTFPSTATTAVTIASGTPATSALTIDAGTANGNIAGNGISQLAAATHTISARLGIGSAQTWTVASGGGLTVSGLVFDTGSGFTLTKAGAGTLTLSNTSNTFTGDINVTAGVLAFAGSAGGTVGGNGDPLSLGAGTKTITITNNAVVRLITTSTNPTSTNTKRFVVGTGGATFDVGTTGITFQLDDATQFSGTGDLTVTSSAGATSTGTVYLNNQAFNFSGNVFVNSGTLRLGNSTVLGTTTGRTITVAAGAALDVNNNSTNIPLSILLSGTGISNAGALTSNSASGTLAAPVTLQSNSSIGAGSGLTQTLTGNIGGAFNLTKVGVGTSAISGTNTYGAGAGVTTTVAAGILLASKTFSLPNYAVAGQVSVSSGATLALGVGGANEFVASDVTNFLTNGTYATGNNSGIGFDTTNAGGTFSAPAITNLTGGAAFNLTKFGTGILVLPSSTAFGTGSTTILNGTVSVTTGVNNTLGTGALILGTSAGVPGNLDIGTMSQTMTTLTVRSNSATANSITIGAGGSLTMTGAVTVGVDTGGTSTTNLTVTGATGTFSIGTAVTPTNANVQLGNNATTNVSNGTTTDLSGVGTFFANLGTGAFRLGDATNSGGTGTAGSTLILAPNTTIKATTITSDSPDGNFTQAIKLGSGNNVLNAGTIEIGGSTSGRANGTLGFNTTSGSLTVRNLAGTGRATLNVGYGATTTGFAISSTVDFTGHSADLLLSTLNIAGRTGSTGGASTATFTMDTGNLDVTGINIATRGGTATTAAGAVTGTVNLLGGTITVGASGIVVAPNTSTISPGTNNAVGTINIGNLGGGSAVTVGATAGTSITLGSATTAAELSNATLNVANGSLTVTGNIIRGTATGTVTSTLALTNTGTLNMAGKDIGASGAPLTTLTFSGGTINNLGNVYQSLNQNGATTVLNVTANNTTVNGAAYTLTSGKANISDGRTLAVGSTTINGTNPTLGIGFGATFAASPGTTSSGLLSSGGALDLTAITATNKLNIPLTLSSGFVADGNTAFTITIATSTAGGITYNSAIQTGPGTTLDPSAFNVTGVGFTVNSYSLNGDANNLTLTITPSAVPEPGTILAVAAAGLGLAAWGRRRRSAKA